MEDFECAESFDDNFLGEKKNLPAIPAELMNIILV